MQTEANNKFKKEILPHVSLVRTLDKHEQNRKSSSHSLKTNEEKVQGYGNNTARSYVVRDMIRK